MLLMIALGHGLVWMLMLTGVMLAEKTLPWGWVLARAVGGVLLVCGFSIVSLAWVSGTAV